MLSVAPRPPFFLSFLIRGPFGRSGQTLARNWNPDRTGTRGVIIHCREAVGMFFESDTVFIPKPDAANADGSEIRDVGP